jgi:uncharacterized SAM-dependent methyltransferase
MTRAKLVIHPSQFPAEVRRALVQSLRSRQLNHKFLYDGLKQTRKWLALHQAFSPSRTDANCAAAYDASFAAAVKEIKGEPVHVVGLGCGGGKKDARLLELLANDSNKGLFYTPLDVSVAMVLEAQQAALAAIPQENCLPVVCDLAEAEDLAGVFDELLPRAVRLFTFFGMLPNFDPETILPRLKSLLRQNDFLLLSANLAPGADYEAGMERILPLYDNDLTRDWLMSFLLELGFREDDGELRFQIEEDRAACGAKRVVVRYRLSRPRELAIDSEPFSFEAGESIQVFFSYRYTPALVESSLKQHGFSCSQRWVSRSEEEGVFLASLNATTAGEKSKG